MFSMKICSFKLFPCSKIGFWPFLKWQKMDFGKKKFFVEIDLFDFTSFFGLDFFKFLARCDISAVKFKIRVNENCFDEIFSNF